VVPVERSAVEVPLGSTTTISAIVHLACIISVMRYLPGDSSPLLYLTTGLTATLAVCLVGTRRYIKHNGK